MLDQKHADRRQFAYLVAAEPAAGPTLVLGELAAAATTRLRVVADDLIDPIVGRQFASRAQVSLLAARLALALPRLANNSLAFARASARRC